ncbi:hypothetical protein CDAR_442361 [Caerostris darwini]|uniref:Uncharacterized protein n=1 Tax=Caerostris darwini TaxID=1538125 RepID=A0AAV4V147_9ARAC|nr:hypothetical protein CDAR_442361 [Caerostris darwini]
MRVKSSDADNLFTSLPILYHFSRRHKGIAANHQQITRGEKKDKEKEHSRHHLPRSIIPYLPEIRTFCVPKCPGIPGCNKKLVSGGPALSRPLKFRAKYQYFHSGAGSISSNISPFGTRLERC